MPATALTIIALGDWPADRLHADSVPSGLRLTPEHHAVIAREWQAASAQRGVDLFDGPLCRLEGLTVDRRGLHLRVSPTSYRVFIGTNTRHPQWADEPGRQVTADPLGTSVVLRTSDGLLLFGRRSQRVALYPGAIHPFGGTVEPPTDGNPLDLLGEMRRELREEIGLGADDLADLRIIAVIEDRHLRQPELVYVAQTRLPASDIIARLDLHEHTACWSLPDAQDAISAVLTGGEPATPVLVGTLLAWGWRRFGEAWLDAHLACRQAGRQPIARWG